MPYQHEKHYTLEEARQLLPQVRQWLQQLQKCHRDLQKADERISQLMRGVNDVGGETVNNWLKTVARTKQLLQEFVAREIQVKDVDRGLVDFPALRAGREIYFCWEQDEDDIEFWHDLDTGYAGREKL